MVGEVVVVIMHDCVQWHLDRYILRKQQLRITRQKLQRIEAIFVSGSIKVAIIAIFIATTITIIITITMNITITITRAGEG